MALPSRVVAEPPTARSWRRCPSTSTRDFASIIAARWVPPLHRGLVVLPQRLQPPLVARLFALGLDVGITRLDALGRLTLRVGLQQVGAVGTGHVPVAGLYRLVIVLGQLGRLLFVGLGERSGLAWRSAARSVQALSASAPKAIQVRCFIGATPGRKGHKDSSSKENGELWARRFRITELPQDFTAWPAQPRPWPASRPPTPW